MPVAESTLQQRDSTKTHLLQSAVEALISTRVKPKFLRRSAGALHKPVLPSSSSPAHGDPFPAANHTAQLVTSPTEGTHRVDSPPPPHATRSCAPGDFLPIP